MLSTASRSATRLAAGRDEMPEDGKFVLVEFRAGEGDDGQLVVGVERRPRVAGEMLAAACDSALAQGGVEGAGIADGLRDVRSVAAAAQGIVRFVVEGDIEHGAEIEIETEEAQQPRGDGAVPLDQFDAAALPQLLRVGRLVADQAQAGHPAALLVDGDDGLDVG